MPTNAHYKAVVKKITDVIPEFIEEIRLSHVLRTIEKVGHFANIDVNGTFVLHGEKGAKVTSWNLEKDNLEDQYPKIWEALDKMLSV